jgi:SSS family solute:Na+ symporter
MSVLATVDWIVTGLYFLVLIAAVLAVARHRDTSTDYFLAGRNIGFFAIGASIFASTIGSGHIVGPAGSCTDRRRPGPRRRCLCLLLVQDMTRQFR